MIGVVACESPTSVTVIEDVRIRMDSHGLIFTNGTSAPIYVWAVDHQESARVDWVGCGMAPVQDPSTDCGPPVPPGEARRLARHEVFGWGISGRVNAYWWHVVRNDEGIYVLDRLRIAVNPSSESPTRRRNRTNPARKRWRISATGVRARKGPFRDVEEGVDGA
jgi:hypothetical protein